MSQDDNIQIIILFYHTVKFMSRGPPLKKNVAVKKSLYPRN